MEELLTKQKEEYKEFQSTLASMRRQGKSGNKKQKKQLNEKIAQLELEFNQKQHEERQKLQNVLDPEESADEPLSADALLRQMEKVSLSSPSVSSTPKADAENNVKPRRNRQKERLERRKERMEAEMREAELASASMGNHRGNEITKMKKLLESLNLKEKDIHTDGHCLFAAIADQMQAVYGKTLEVKQLREMAANFVEQNADNFAAFLFDEETNSVTPIDKYCSAIRKTAKWGGDVELRALCNSLNVPIKVLCADAPTITFTPETETNTVADKKPLTLSYYQHLYGLGAHYNSVHEMND
ncbi:OTU family cysteine protease [Schizosaccharomyces japonicus yFS275]|uniref:OTU family cysteine protease n=1 Tax=Schizosaccharomyces japonicus (strain yFS275 / FY16936) TaxID=402676 RepID=B6K152_SCHJY|nr:OTU family cysteine protease [Schizosaccharomyces japonicus yFS275]EEB07673.1 OTU family cysteine protease [Schizosaccharomyces japonicus yFS275]